MAVYAINYELRERPPKDYTNVVNAIKGASNGNYKLMMGTFWLIESGANAREVYNHLARYMHKGDLLLVQRVTNDFACSLPADCVEWLQKVMAYAPNAAPAKFPPLDLA